jgi:hypothetical protein
MWHDSAYVTASLLQVTCYVATHYIIKIKRVWKLEASPGDTNPRIQVGIDKENKKVGFDHIDVTPLLLAPSSYCTIHQFKFVY